MKSFFKSHPQWTSLVLALIAITIIKAVWKRVEQPNKWASLEAVTKKSAIDLIPDTSERRKWVGCVIATFKRKYPDGNYYTSQDSFNVRCATISYDCIHAIRRSQN